MFIWQHRNANIQGNACEMLVTIPYATKINSFRNSYLTSRPVINTVLSKHSLECIYVKSIQIKLSRLQSLVAKLFEFSKLKMNGSQ